MAEIDRDRSEVRFERWSAWRMANGVAWPTADDFLGFGRLSTLERLAPAIDRHAREQAPALIEALRQRRREKRLCAAPRASGGRRGPAQKLSVDEADLPLEWRRLLFTWRAECRRLDAGGICLDDYEPPPAADMIEYAAYVLRAIAKACVDAGREPALTAETVGAWLTAAEDRDCKSAGLALQLSLVIRVQRVLGGAPELIDGVVEVRSRHRRRAEREAKRKEAWLRANPRRLGDVWAAAEALLAEAMATPPTRYRRARLVREAAALALAVAAPLRVGDLGRFVIGKHLARSATGWSLTVVTRKKRHPYERPELWPELTPFLDAVVMVDAGDADSWSAYDRKVGTPLFSRDGGATALSSDWISDVWAEHVGCVAHIVRTLWHEVAHESEADLTWMALALCGQKDQRTARHYQVRNAKRRALTKGRALLKRARAAAAQA